ncbi:mitochondrial import inner membrane translocase subunit Tim8 B [Latimeria chalumnae]|uniref:Mitochondrial import inner membrane translocase subunit n=1 Tax=Latimeria chalumnae TaxID=7897 RepID=H3B836_LATCH|nr:PREDICTED: mitochondrial import inner membrane translocase subunit Tim8 B [Latimeria chalumnae]|eukprot:XP_005987296.1 PREDICTED: mitochondrial import inner membrane translocase subunit Tim8 B [Latimeria chalumnae]
MSEFGSDLDFSSGSSVPEKAEASELQRMIAIEQQKAQFQAQVHNFMDVCWDKCVDKPGSRMDSRMESCLVSCVDRFIDTTLTITNRFSQMVQKGGY